MESVPDYATLRPRVKSSKKHPRSTFSQDEDCRLKCLVSRYGFNWSAVSEEMPNRSVRQCRDRWKSYLSPDIHNCPWSDFEDALLLRKVEECGSKWVHISKFFPHRTDAHLKNRWFQLMRRRLRLSKLEGRTKTKPETRTKRKIGVGIGRQWKAELESESDSECKGENRSFLISECLFSGFCYEESQSHDFCATLSYEDQEDWCEFLDEWLHADEPLMSFDRYM